MHAAILFLSHFIDQNALLVNRNLSEPLFYVEGRFDELRHDIYVEDVDEKNRNSNKRQRR